MRVAGHAQVSESVELFQKNLLNVLADDAINWDHENIERYLRTFRNLKNSLSPLYEVRPTAGKQW